MIGSPCCLEADHDEIVELSSSSRRKEGLPPGHRGGRGEQPVHPRGGGGTPSPLVGWAGGRWLVGAHTPRFSGIAAARNGVASPAFGAWRSSSAMRRMSVEPCPCLASRCPLNGAGRAAGAIGADLPQKSYVARNPLVRELTRSCEQLFHTRSAHRRARMSRSHGPAEP